MKITSLGHGGAFAGIDKGNTAFLIEFDSGKKMLFDCGTLTPYILRDEMGINFHDIDAIYISHSHADHWGGLPLFLQSRYWIPKRDKKGERILPLLIMDGEVSGEICDILETEVKHYKDGERKFLKDFAEINSLWTENGFDFDNTWFNLEFQSHVEYRPGDSKTVAGLSFDYKGKSILFTADTSTVAPLEAFDIVFHDCETSVGFKSGVHAHLEDIVTYCNTLDFIPSIYMVHFTNEPAEPNASFVWFKKGTTIEL